MQVGENFLKVAKNAAGQCSNTNTKGGLASSMDELACYKLHWSIRDELNKYHNMVMNAPAPGTIYLEADWKDRVKLNIII